MSTDRAPISMTSAPATGEPFSSTTTPRMPLFRSTRASCALAPEAHASAKANAHSHAAKRGSNSNERDGRLNDTAVSLHDLSRAALRLYKGATCHRERGHPCPLGVRQQADSLTPFSTLS